MEEIHKSMQKLAAGYLSGGVSLDDFRVGFAGLYFRARQAKNEPEANLLAGKIVGPLAEYARGHRSEVSLRETISAAVGSVADLAAA